MNTDYKKINRELAEKIHEAHERLGITPPASEWWWCQDDEGWKLTDSWKGIAAPDTPELKTMLQGRIKKGVIVTFFDYYEERWVAKHCENYNGEVFDFTFSNTEANACGDLYLEKLED